MSEETRPPRVRVELTRELAATEADDAKAHWRATKSMGLAYGVRGPDYARTICSLIAATRPRTVFEFGCNAGRNLKLLESFVAGGTTMFGIDINEESVRYGREEVGLDLAVGDESFLSGVADSSWDVVFTVSVLDHVPRADAILGELERIAGRYLFVYEPCLDGRQGRILDVTTEAEDGSVAPYSYFHDYGALMAASPSSLVLELPLPPKEGGIGPLYRLLVWAKPGVTAPDFHAVLGE